MAYFSQDGSMHGWNGPHGYVPAAPITRILCNGCAQAEIPFEQWPPTPNHPHGIAHQCAPWKWAPVFGGKTPCDACGKEC